MLHPIVVLVAASAAAAANGREAVSFTIKWDKAVVAPGEVQTGSVWAEFAPGVGELAIWNTPGGGESAIVAAFASSQGNLLNILNGATGALTWTVPEALNIAMKPGTADGQGGIKGSSAGQFGPPANPDPITDNPIRILDLAWATDNGTPRPIAYRFDALATKIFLDVPSFQWTPDPWIPVDSPDTAFEVIPGPGAIAGLGLAALVRRRRRPVTR
jgi:hypothetical protein